MSRLKIWSGIIAIYLFGVVSGGAVLGIYLKHKEHSFRTMPALQAAAMAGKRMTRWLSLSEPQRESIRPILVDGFQRVRKAQEQGFTAVQSVLQDTLNKASPLLTPDQAAKLKDRMSTPLARIQQKLDELHSAE